MAWMSARSGAATAAAAEPEGTPGL
jgi:hypothetical protein